MESIRLIDDPRHQFYAIFNTATQRFLAVTLRTEEYSYEYSDRVSHKAVGEVYDSEFGNPVFLASKEMAEELIRDGKYETADNGEYELTGRAADKLGDRTALIVVPMVPNVNIMD